MGPSSEAPMRVLGMISGTSVDAIDTAICELAPDEERGPGGVALRLLAHREHAFPEPVRRQVLALLRQLTCRLDDLTELNVTLGEAFADAALAALAAAGLKAGELDLIASHGQTIYHLVEPGRTRATLQMGEPAVIARRTGVTVVADFRVADIAAGGEGAPLAPFLDAVLLGGDGRTHALQNIGGIGNVTFLPAGAAIEEAYAFDTGPGNVLIDCGARYFSGGREQFDRDGMLARAGRPDATLLEKALSHPYFRRPPPKSTGRELFGDAFALELIARAQGRELSPPDIMATLTALTVESILAAYRDFGPERVDQVVLSGGGARNPAIVEGLRAGLPGTTVTLYDDLGLPSDAKEAVLFALLGYEAIHGRPANLPRCTGAAEPAILGAITPGANFHSLLRRVTVARRTMEPTPCQPTRTLRLLR